MHYSCASLTRKPAFSYDLDMDTQLAEETTTVVESYIVRFPMAEQSRSALNSSRRPSACPSHTQSTSSN
ncbi:hypothetical protein BGW80DRAFT_1416596, partial [Lactifluus volemus]